MCWKTTLRQDSIEHLQFCQSVSTIYGMQGRYTMVSDTSTSAVNEN
jgi:hypothetical protein